MRYSTVSGLMLAALIGEVVAGPTHAHLHRRAHQNQKKEVDWESLDWANMGIDWSSAWAAGQHSKTAAPVAAPTPAAVAPVAPAPKPAAPTAAAKSSVADSLSSSSIASTVEGLWEDLVGLSNSRTSFGASSAASGSLGDNYVGNVGVPYGANVIKVSSTTGYDFTNTFINTQSKPITVNIWQKVGPDGRALSGSALAPTKTTLTFVLAPGAKQVVAFQDNTQVSWAEACDKFAASGAFAITWGEANFVPTGSGYDVSAIMNSDGNNYDMTITSAENSCVSSRTENFWLTATQPIGGSDGSCYVPDSTMHLTTKMGGVI